MDSILIRISSVKLFWPLGGIQAWVAHVRTATNLLIWRRPSLFSHGSSPESLKLLSRLRNMSVSILQYSHFLLFFPLLFGVSSARLLTSSKVWFSYVYRTRNPFDSPEWLGLSTAPCDVLSDIIVRIPSILKNLEAAKSVEAKSSGDLQPIISRCHVLQHELMNWYPSLQSYAGEKSLFVLVPIAREVAASHAPLTDAIWFKTSYDAQLLLGYQLDDQELLRCHFLQIASESSFSIPTCSIRAISTDT